MQYSVGRALYDLIYDRLTFNRRGPGLIRQQSKKKLAVVDSGTSDSGERSEAPVLFEVLTEYPLEMRKEVKVGDIPLPIILLIVVWLGNLGYSIARCFATNLHEGLQFYHLNLRLASFDCPL